MSIIIRSSLKALYIGFVALALAVGAYQVRASAAVDCGGPGQLGPCPPLTDASCNCACQEEFGTVGTCGVEGCCECTFFPEVEA